MNQPQEEPRPLTVTEERDLLLALVRNLELNFRAPWISMEQANNSRLIAWGRMDGVLQTLGERK